MATMAEDVAAQIKAAFQEVDESHSGYVDEDVVKSLFSAVSSLPMSACEKLLKRAPRNEKGLVAYETFLEWLMDPKGERKLSKAGSPPTVAPNGIYAKKRAKLANLDLFVLDNSLRESTVGQVVGHTLADKLKILDAVKSCGFEWIVIAALNSSRRVDDQLAAHLKNSGDDMSKYFAFTEDADACKDGAMLYGPDHVPAAMVKMKRLGVPNPIIECDLADDSIDWDGKFTVDKLEELLEFLLTWAHKEMGCQGRAFVNIRDFPLAMAGPADRTLRVVRFLKSLPDNIRPMGILVEEPMGTFFPEEVSGWCAKIRGAMGDWGRLCVHVHKQWGMADAVVMECLAVGVDGIWCSVSEDGAGMGHACSAVTIANLARLGNRKVAKKYKCNMLGSAARKVTMLTTTESVAERQIVYGPRAAEVVFDFAGIAGGGAADGDGDGDIDEIDKFSLAEFLGMDKPPIRITTLSSPNLIVQRLKEDFGDETYFTEDVAKQMLLQMEEDLQKGKREDYSSPAGLALLYTSVTEQPTEGMTVVLESQNHTNEATKKLLQECEDLFREICANGDQDKEELLPKNPSMGFLGFYNGYLQPYFGCFTCKDTRIALDSIDCSDDGEIEWMEWRFWCVWALRSYDDIRSLDDLHNRIFRHALLPSALSKKPGNPEPAKDAASTAKAAAA
eukprot:TRINITY_DN260_c0_g2_i1.p1 TRINITY_DN260_c0_g2~~TRINITY_DN260_c0_g2_i1.p1  ORF type:complete len:673 (-),score=189.23 TRINITY_DN260_c0_g2_i1:275-2293(-)